MTYQQGLRLVTRGIAVYLLLWAIGDLLTIPREVITIGRILTTAHSEASVYSSAYNKVTLDYLRTESGFLIENILKIALWISLAIWFQRCGPSIQRYFAVHEPVDPTTPPQP